MPPPLPPPSLIPCCMQPPFPPFHHWFWRESGFALLRKIALLSSFPHRFFLTHGPRVVGQRVPLEHFSLTPWSHLLIFTSIPLPEQVLRFGLLRASNRCMNQKIYIQSFRNTSSSPLAFFRQHFAQRESRVSEIKCILRELEIKV